MPLLRRSFAASQRWFSQLLLLFLLFVSPPRSKQAVDFFGGNGTLGGQFESAEGVAVNYSGAGGVRPARSTLPTAVIRNPSQRGNRVQRFQREDNGTPGIPPMTPTPSSPSGAPGSSQAAAIMRSASKRPLPAGRRRRRQRHARRRRLAQQTLRHRRRSGHRPGLRPRLRLQAHPDDHFRVNLYSATGAFLRSFGTDVVESGPGNAGTGYEICVAATATSARRALQARASASRVIGNGERAPQASPSARPTQSCTGTVFLADQHNRRINIYNLDGSSPGSIGSAPSSPPTSRKRRRRLARHRLCRQRRTIERYDSQGVDGPSASSPDSAGVARCRNSRSVLRRNFQPHL